VTLRGVSLRPGVLVDSAISFGSAESKFSPYSFSPGIVSLPAVFQFFGKSIEWDIPFQKSRSRDRLGYESLIDTDGLLYSRKFPELFCQII